MQPIGAALQHDGGAAAHARMSSQRRQRSSGAAGDRDLFLGADDQVAVGQDRLQMLRHAVGVRRSARSPAAVAGEAPQVRPVVDVEHDLGAGLALRDRHRLALRPPRCSAVEKCVPVTTIARAEADERRVDIGFVERHVGAVARGRRSAAKTPSDPRTPRMHQRGQPLRVGDDAVRRRRPRAPSARG